MGRAWWSGNSGPELWVKAAFTVHFLRWDFWLLELTDIGVLQASPAPCIARLASTENLDFGPRFLVVIGLAPSWQLELDVVDLMEVR